MNIERDHHAQEQFKKKWKTIDFTTNFFWKSLRTPQKLTLRMSFFSYGKELFRLGPDSMLGHQVSSAILPYRPTRTRSGYALMMYCTCSLCTLRAIVLKIMILFFRCIMLYVCLLLMSASSFKLNFKKDNQDSALQLHEIVREMQYISIRNIICRLFSKCMTRIFFKPFLLLIYYVVRYNFPFLIF